MNATHLALLALRSGLVIAATLLFYRYVILKVPTETWKKLAYFSVSLLAVVSIYNVRLQRQTSQANRKVITTTAETAVDIKAITKVVQEQTSPEGVARQKAAVDDIVARLSTIIDCNQRQALQDALQGLVRRGILAPDDVVTITQACNKRNQETTTSTTSPTTTTTTKGN